MTCHDNSDGLLDALIVCIGNDLVADDGVGQAVYKELGQRTLPAAVRLRLLGLGGMALLSEIDGEYLLVVVDAVAFGVAPGTVHVLNWQDLPKSGSHVSCHGIGVREAIEVAHRLYPEKAPASVWLVGVEGQCFDQLGQGLTPSVAANIGAAADAVLTLLQQSC